MPAGGKPNIAREIIKQGDVLPQHEGFVLSAPVPKHLAARFPARTLAYIGDSVFELDMRVRHVFAGIPHGGEIHGSLVKIVCADNQARLFDDLFETVQDEEKELLKSWRNAKSPKKQLSTTRGAYAKSTAFEAWVGFLFITGQNKRLQDLLMNASASDQGAELKPSHEIE